MKMFEFEFSKNSKQIFEAILKYIKDWCADHQWAIGIAEMAAGAAILKWGIQTGSIELGKHAVATELSSKVAAVGGAIGAGLGGLSCAMVGSIGVAAMGGAIGIPAIALIGGGALLLGAAGYTGSHLIYNFLKPPIDYSSSLRGSSLVVLGTVLIVDGARRFWGDKKVKDIVASFKAWVLRLPELTTKIVADTSDKLRDIIREIASLPENEVDALGNVAAIAGGAAAGVAFGGGIAGPTAILLALAGVSPPVWPVIAAGVAGAAGAHILWKICTKWDDNPSCE